jgi:hypothetical protein
MDAARVNAAATAHPRPSLPGIPRCLLIDSPNLLKGYNQKAVWSTIFPENPRMNRKNPL